MMSNFTQMRSVYEWLRRPEIQQLIITNAFCSKLPVPAFTTYNSLRVAILCIMRLKSAEKRLDNHTQGILIEIYNDMVLNAKLSRLGDDIAKCPDTKSIDEVLADHSETADQLEVYLVRMGFFEEIDEGEST